MRHYDVQKTPPVSLPFPGEELTIPAYFQHIDFKQLFLAVDCRVSAYVD